MTELCHLGLDVSTTGAGAVLLGADDEIKGVWCWQSDEGSSEDVRLRALRRWSNEVFEQISQLDAFVDCAIERPFARGEASVALAGAEWIVRSAYECDWVAYPPQSVKKTAHDLTGIQTAGIKDLGKEPMMEAFGVVADAESFKKVTREAYHFLDGDKALGDLVDAFWVAKTHQLATAGMRGE